MPTETLIGFLLSSLLSPAGFIGFCCGLARSLPGILGGAIAATILETFLAFAVSTSGVDPLYVLMTPIASLIASGIGWLVARVFFGKRDKAEADQPNQSARLAYKEDVLEPGHVEDF